MATPTPMKHAPSQQGRTPSQSQHIAATPPVSTPFSATQGHVAFSPHGPKSSPSHLKRSPANLLNHPSNPPVNFDSPTAVALGALGIGNGMDMNLDHIGVGGLAGLGPVERDDDDERAKRLHQILGMVKENKGRVSEEGLERLVKSIGLECLWDPSSTNDGSKTLIIAGSALSVDIVMSNNIVQQVSLSFPESADIVSKHVDQAGQILLNDLKLGPHESPLTKRLDKFALNLERLALLDRLSVIPGFNCHEAIAGIHESLERLHQWDMARLRADPAMAGRSEDFLLATVLCSRHGYPGMHKRDRVGMTFDYWKERHLVPASSPETREFRVSSDRTWGVWIGCAPSITTIGCQPARVSNSWLSPSVEAQGLLLGAARPDGQPVLDWQQPENTFIPRTEEEEKADAAMGLEFQNAKLPEVVFVAEFDPPVVIAYHDWASLYRDMSLPATDFPGPHMATFDNLIFPRPPGNYDPTETRNIKRVREVPIFDRDGQSSPAVATHKYSLFMSKPVYGQTLTSLPFSHPSQLVDVLPRLRQYAFLSTLLDKSFGPGTSKPVTSDARDGQRSEAEPDKKDQNASTVEHTIGTTTKRDEYWAFMKGAKGQRDETGDPAQATGAALEGAKEPLSVDVTLIAHPALRLQVVFPFRETTAMIVLEIQLNGIVHIMSQNVLQPPDEEAEGAAAGEPSRRGIQPQDLGRMLQICEDLGQWCEWIRSRLE